MDVAENGSGPGGQYGPFAFCAIVALLPSMGIPRGLGNEDEITEAEILAKTAEVARHVSTWHGASRD